MQGILRFGWMPEFLVENRRNLPYSSRLRPRRLHALTWHGRFPAQLIDQRRLLAVQSVLLSSDSSGRIIWQPGDARVRPILWRLFKIHANTAIAGERRPIHVPNHGKTFGRASPAAFRFTLSFIGCAGHNKAWLFYLCEISPVAREGPCAGGSRRVFMFKTWFKIPTHSIFADVHPTQCFNETSALLYARDRRKDRMDGCCRPSEQVVHFFFSVAELKCIYSLFCRNQAKTLPAA